MRSWSLVTWIRAFADDPKAWKSKLTIACQSSTANRMQAWAVTPALRSLSMTWHCDVCDVDMPTRQGLAAHKWRKHGIKRPEHLLVDTSHCEICMVEFHTRTMLLAHICEKSEVCRMAYWSLGAKLDSAQADELDVVEATKNRSDSAVGLRRGCAKFSCKRLQGPLRREVADQVQSNGTLVVGRRLLS